MRMKHSWPAVLGLVVLSACASVSGDHASLVPSMPKPILVKARSELVRMGYTITDEPTDTVTLEPGREPIGGYVRGEKLVGRDFDSPALIFEVLSVTAHPEAGQTRILVHGGMELGLPLSPRSATSSTADVRKRAAELLKRLQ